MKGAEVYVKDGCVCVVTRQLSERKLYSQLKTQYADGVSDYVLRLKWKV